MILIAVTGIIVMNVSVFQSANPVPDKVILVTSGVPQYFAGAQPGHSGADAPLTNEQVGLSVFDNSLVWQTNTLVNIFEHNDPRVKSDGTGKAHYVIAPGTSNRYIFTLRNDKEKPIRYQLRIEGGNDSQYTIPVNLKILDPYGKSMLGDDPILIKDMEDIVRMGSYVQDDPAKRKPIEWQVLTVNKKAGQALLLSVRALDAVAFGEAGNTEEYTRVGLNWENSAVRNWLNGDFYAAVFSDTEKDRILETALRTK
ncbi:MAG: DUF6273 domain-containing protein, partial [Acutalibacteraceae bacterium]|nr:DUF6273 domain-containing protein [Acutalibacteraceae bacterium]